MLACRACRTPLTSTEGCAVCLEWKPHLVDTDESAEERPALSEVGAESVNALRAMLREARAALAERRPPAPDRDWFRRREYSQNLVLKTSNSLAKVLEAARKLQTDGLAAIRNMSFLERAELFIGWYAALVPAYRTSVRSQMDRYEESLVPKRALPEGPPA